jgi:hypothetical protein
MYVSQIGSKLRVQIHDFSGKLSPRLSKPIGRFVEQMLYGILVSKDVKLSQIGRALEESISPKKTEDRLSTNLNSDGLAGELLDQVACLGSRRVQKDALLILDTSDIRKAYAKKMEYLARVRDGSKKELADGYWLCDVIACQSGGNDIIPLYQSLYSAAAPEHQSENDELLKAVDTVTEHCGTRGIWVADRGMDRNNIYNPLLDRKLRFIVRMRGDRNLLFRGRCRLAEDIARGCPSYYQEVVVKETAGEEKTYRLAYGFRRVRLPGRTEELYLVVVRGFGEAPLMLLTNLPLRRNRRVLWSVVEGYLTRWRIEEAIRFTKQSYNLEDIRVLTYRRLCNLTALVLAASYFAAVHLGDRLRLAVLTRRVLQAARRFYGIASFRYYAIADGISYILRRLGKGPLCPSTPPSDDRQLSFSKFT